MWTMGNKTFTTRNQLQKLLGHLIYISRSIKPSRLFVNRMLQSLRSIPSNGKKKLDTGFFRDLKWFIAFLDTFNGSVEMHLFVKAPQYNVHMDACLKGMGAICNKMVYYTPVHPSLQQLCHITHLEAANALIVLRKWGSMFKNKYIILWCDNKAVVEVFASYKIRDPFLAACICTIWWYSAIYNFKLEIKQNVSRMCMEIFCQDGQFFNLLIHPQYGF